MRARTHHIPLTWNELMKGNYDAIVAEVLRAGFFTTSVESMGGWDRVTCCSKQAADGRYHGHSFWVTDLPEGWHLGTWGGMLYRFSSEQQVAPLCIAWMTRHPDRIVTVLDPDIVDQFGLVEVSSDEFDRRYPDQR